MMERKQIGLSLHGSGDVISNLPENVMNLILTRLPLRDAMRTTILSKNWRHKWTRIPDLVFDEATLMEGASVMDRAFVVNEVLLRHVGPILKFSCMCFIPSCRYIDNWFSLLSREGIETYILKIADGGDRYDVPPHGILLCQSLHQLELFNCIVKVPPTFKGFHNLKVLKLDVDISEAAAECLISKSPLLERLKLKAYRYIRCLKIHAPNLRYLEVEGIFQDLSLGSSPLLTDVSICKFYRPSYLPHCKGNLEQVITYSFIQFIEYSHGIERLAVKGYFLQFLCLGDVPEKLIAPYEHLKYLDIDVNLDPKELLATLCILRSSPNLKELKFEYRSHGGNADELKADELKADALSRKEAEFWGAATRFDFSLSHLQTMEINGLTASFNLEFIRYILSKAPVLKTMIIRTNNKCVEVEVSRMLTQLLQFRRASARAECLDLGHEEIEYIYGLGEIDEWGYKI